MEGRQTLPWALGAPETEAAYQSFLRAHVLCDGPHVNVSGTSARVEELVAAYLVHLDRRYADDTRRSEFGCTRDALRVVVNLAGHLFAADFGPLRLKAVQAAMVDLGWTRGYINHQIQRVRRCFRWGVSEELVPPTVLAGLEVVQPLRRGQTTAPESPKRVPANYTDVYKTLWLLPGPLRAAVSFQWYTAARPENVCKLVPWDVDASADIWVWRPDQHKTDYLGKSLTIFIGPRAQEMIRPYMDRDSYCFAPLESLAWTARHRGHKPRRPKNTGCRYSTQSYYPRHCESPESRWSEPLDAVSTPSQSRNPCSRTVRNRGSPSCSRPRFVGRNANLRVTIRQV